MKTTKKAEMGCLAILAALAIFPIGLLTEGAVVALLWRWFMVPLHLPALGISHALGLSTLATVLTAHHAPKPSATEDVGGEAVAKAYGAMAGRYLAIVCIGLCAHLAIGRGW